MENINRCACCILPESLPSVELDEVGVCGHCRTYERLVGDWEAVKDRRRERFEDLLRRVKELGRSYDCLIPLSGGKDSTYALYVLSKVYGLRCLCVTFDNGYLSEHARTNIENAIEAANSDRMFYGVGRDTLLRLYRLFMAKCGSFCPVCMRGIEASIALTVRTFRIPLVVRGDGRRISYLSIVPELFQGGDEVFFQNVVEGEPLEQEVAPLVRTFPRPTEEVAKYLYRFRIARKGLRLLGVSADLVPLVPRSIGLYDWIDVSYDEIYATLEQEMGWTRPPHHPEHMDCLLHEIPSYVHRLRFPELTTATVYRSGLIRMGAMTRVEAMRAEQDELNDPKPPPRILDSFLEEIEMTEEDFETSARDWQRVEEFREKR